MLFTSWWITVTWGESEPYTSSDYISHSRQRWDATVRSMYDLELARLAGVEKLWAYIWLTDGLYRLGWVLRMPHCGCSYWWYHSDRCHFVCRACYGCQAVFIFNSQHCGWFFRTPPDWITNCDDAMISIYSDALRPDAGAVPQPARSQCEVCHGVRYAGKSLYLRSGW